jgi:Effector Associated Constant Component 1
MWLLAVDGAGTPEDLEDLFDWLRGRPELRGYVRSGQGPALEGALGASAVDLISVAIGSGGLLSVLAGSLQSWFAQPRPRRNGVIIKITREDGKEEIEVHAGRSANVESLMRSMTAHPDQAD